MNPFAARAPRDAFDLACARAQGPAVCGAAHLPAPAAAPRELDLAAEIELSEKAKSCIEWISFSLSFQCDKDFTFQNLEKCLLAVANKLHYPPESIDPQHSIRITPHAILTFPDISDDLNDVLFNPGTRYKLTVEPNHVGDPKAVLQAFNVVQEAFAELNFEDLVMVLLRRRDNSQERFYQLPRTEM